MVYGCCSTSSTVREEKIAVAPPAIEELLPTYTRDDYVHALKIDLNVEGTDTLRDTLIDIKYYPKIDLMDVKVKPKPYWISDLDSVEVTENIIEETSFWEKMGFAFGGFVVIMVLVLLFKKL